MQLMYVLTNVYFASLIHHFVLCTFSLISNTTVTVELASLRLSLNALHVLLTDLCTFI